MEGRATRHRKNHTVQSLLIAIISYLLRAKGQALSLWELGYCQEHAALRKPEGDAWEKEGNGLFRKKKKKERKKRKKVNLAFWAQSLKIRVQDWLNFIFQVGELYLMPKDESYSNFTTIRHTRL